MLRSAAHLKVNGLSAGYGAFLVLRDLRLEVKPGLTVILGPNGAGKTTLLKAIAGPDSAPGRGAARRTRSRAHRPPQIVRRGMALVPEGRQLFPQMTVTENLELGGWLVNKASAPSIEQALNDFPKLASVPSSWPAP